MCHCPTTYICWCPSWFTFMTFTTLAHPSPSSRRLVLSCVLTSLWGRAQLKACSLAQPACVNAQLKNRILPGMLEHLPFDDVATNTCPGITNTPLTSDVPSVDGVKGLDSWRNKSRNTYDRYQEYAIIKATSHTSVSGPPPACFW